MKKIMKWMLPILASVMLIVVGCTSTDSPRGTVKAFYKNCLKGDFTKAFSYTRAGEMGEMMVEKMGAELAEAGLKGYKIESETLSSNKLFATVTVREYYQKEEGETIEKLKLLKVAKVDGEWKILID